MNILFLFDIFGTFVFALSGAVKAVKNKMDVLGVVVFAITVGCAGGMIRDVLLGVSVAAYTNSVYMIISCIAGVVVFILSKVTNIEALPSHIVIFDAIGLGFFTAMGCEKASLLGVSYVGIIFSGVISSVGGGVLRDMFSKEVPMIFRQDFYASASILGSLLFLLLRFFGLSSTLNLWITAIFTILSRIVGYKLHLNLPVAGKKEEKND